MLTLLLALAIALVLSAPVAAEEKAEKNTHLGTFLRVGSDGNSFTMKDSDGKEHAHTLAVGFKAIGEDGKEAKLSDFTDGQRVRVTTQEGDRKVATKLEALKKE
jgi:hypothetical protein